MAIKIAESALKRKVGRVGGNRGIFFFFFFFFYALSDIVHQIPSRAEATQTLPDRPTAYSSMPKLLAIICDALRDPGTRGGTTSPRRNAKQKRRNNICMI